MNKVPELQRILVSVVEETLSDFEKYVLKHSSAEKAQEFSALIQAFRNKTLTGEDPKPEVVKKKKPRFVVVPKTFEEELVSEAEAEAETRQTTSETKVIEVPSSSPAVQSAEKVIVAPKAKKSTKTIKRPIEDVVTEAKPIAKPEKKKANVVEEGNTTEGEAPEKNKRKQSAYILFIKEAMSSMGAEVPGGKERMRRAVEMWKARNGGGEN
jgi:hypothetical protein